MAGTAPCDFTNSAILRRPPICESSQMPVSPCVMRPRFSTAVASTNTTPAPPWANLPRCTRCQSVTWPSCAEYWHMGETTIRLRIWTSRMRIASKSISIHSQPSGDGEFAAALRRDDHHFAGVRRDPGQRDDGRAVRHHDQIAFRRRERFQLCNLLIAVLVAAEKIAEHGGDFVVLAEGERCGLDAPAPGAGDDALDRDRLLAKRLADAPRVRATLVGEVALRAAVLELESRRIAGAGRGDRMADEDHLAAALEQRP